MIRKKYTFTFFDEKVEVQDLLVGEYLEILSENLEIYKKIFGRKVEKMNERQIKNALKFLISGEKEKPKIFKKEKQTIKNDDFFIDFLILEGRIMHFLNQSRSEIRSWTLRYFNRITESLAVIIGEEKYEDFKNKNKPDKKGIKDILTPS